MAQGSGTNARARRTGGHRRSRRTLAAALVLAAALLVAPAVAPAGAAADDGDVGISGKMQALMGKPRFRTATWAILAVDVDTGEVVVAHNRDKLMAAGSNTKIFSVGTALDVFGPDHTFVTPVYAVGSRQGATLAGNLVLVASGDLVFGGRTTDDGTVEVVLGDHNDANALPFGALTPQDPLTGLRDLAQQVAAAGITDVTGDVLIDDRLFETNHEFFHGVVSPIVVNDNLVDVTVTPGPEGALATVEHRPASPAYTVVSQVSTVAAGEETSVTLRANDDESVITAIGQIAADADPLLRVHEVEAPAAFARTLFIEELRAAGVTVAAPAVGPNPDAALPDPAAYTDEVASFTSPELRQIANLIMKVSYNRGADLMMCLLATTVDSTDCDDGLAVAGDLAAEAGVPGHSYLLEDGSGGEERNRLAPAGTVGFLRYLAEQRYGKAFRNALPVLGKAGSLAITTVEGPAVGNVFAKTGTAAWGFPDGQDGIFVGAKALGGYIRTADGRNLAFAVYVNDAVVKNVDQMLNIGVDDMAALIYAEH